jgi:hypothetical protein
MKVQILRCARAQILAMLSIGMLACARRERAADEASAVSVAAPPPSAASLAGNWAPAGVTIKSMFGHPVRFPPDARDDSSPTDAYMQQAGGPGADPDAVLRRFGDTLVRSGRARELLSEEIATPSTIASVHFTILPDSSVTFVLPGGGQEHGASVRVFADSTLVMTASPWLNATGRLVGDTIRLESISFSGRELNIQRRGMAADFVRP